MAFLKFKNNSIKKTLIYSYMLIIILMILPSFYSTYVSSLYFRQYNNMITRVSNANRLNQIVKIEISNEIWDIVAGKTLFNEGRQYQIIRTIQNEIEGLINSDSQNETVQYLQVASRALRTLEKYVDMLGSQILEGTSVDKNELILEEVRGVSALIYDILQDYIVAQIESASATNDVIKKNSFFFTLIQALIITIAFLIAIQSHSSVSLKIRKPIQQLELLSTQIAEGNLSARVEIPHVDELDNLTFNLNLMTEKIQNLIDQNIKEQKNFQKEQMKTLQAQITPHFLYNTFDTIIWLAESSRTNEVIEITRAFSSFFRISLSKGRDWITVAQELEHVHNYLKIQKIRYRDILDFTISVDKEVEAFPVLKLILQPIVENAIYHGIKNKRTRGHLDVSATLGKENSIVFTIRDDGIGISNERMQEIKHELDKYGTLTKMPTIYGLYNVSKRLTLYYGGRSTFNIESTFEQGTCVTIIVPSEEPNV